MFNFLTQITKRTSSFEKRKKERSTEFCDPAINRRQTFNAISNHPTNQHPSTDKREGTKKQRKNKQRKNDKFLNRKKNTIARKTIKTEIPCCDCIMNFLCYFQIWLWQPKSVLSHSMECKVQAVGEMKILIIPTKKFIRKFFE